MNTHDTGSFYLRPYVDARQPQPQPSKWVKAILFILPLLPILLAAAIGYGLGVML